MLKGIQCAEEGWIAFDQNCVPAGARPEAMRVRGIDPIGSSKLAAGPDGPRADAFDHVRKDSVLTMLGSRIAREAIQ
jgi:hypothetical protein